MLLFRRFLVVQLLLVWQGGFLFYSAIVVPLGTEVLGSAEAQGAVTARVTDTLNAIGVIGIVGLALELVLTRGATTSRSARRWVTWGIAALCQCLLLYLHSRLAGYMDAERKHVIAREAFYPVHAAYLYVSAVQWLACLLFTWWTLKVWRAEDAERPVSASS